MPDAAPPPSSAADGELVARAAQGDEGALGQLYDRYGAVLYAVAYRIAGQRADAEEIVLEAFAQAWREAPGFEAGRGSVAGWLTMIARSRALDLVRARSRRERITASAAADRLGVSPAMGEFRADPGGALDHDERRRQVRQALESLSPPQRQAIELAYFEGLSQSEIAERLQEPLGTVKTRVRLGMQKLRECLRPFYFERGT
jgi:RNA polymerase sigma-70 factor, ECF subfamily